MASLRDHHSGDLGWIVSRHGEFYAREFGWGIEFEGIVAQIVADFARTTTGPDDAVASRQRCWIAEHDGQRAGSVMLSRDDDGTARLRLMLVESQARGLGLGRSLGQAVIDQARAWGDDQIVLWTTSKQEAARALYAAFGFECVSREPNQSFAPDAMDEEWRLPL